LSPQLVYWAIASSLAGFLFGFDTVVISGAEQAIEIAWRLYTSIIPQHVWMHLVHGVVVHKVIPIQYIASPFDGVVVASALYGTIVGALLGGIPSDAFGRKKSLIAIGVLYVISALWSGVAHDPLSFMVARILGGLGVGMSTVVAPVYISEIAPPAHRGRLTGLFQFNIVFGIIIAQGSNALLGHFLKGDIAWRWMFGVAAIPSLIYVLMCFGLPESPRWLLLKGRRTEGVDVLGKVMPGLTGTALTDEADEIERASKTPLNGSGAFFSRRLIKPIMLAFLIAFFNQWSGINAVLYFSKRIFQSAGMTDQQALNAGVGLGIANLIFTIVGLYLIDRVGRKTLLIIGSIGYIASLSLTAWSFSSGNYALVPWFVYAFIGSHAVGQGAVIWVYISEIFPPQFRANGQALGCGTHWVMAALISTYFPRATGLFSPTSIFLFFAFMMVLQLIWSLTMVVETKGIPLEEVQEKLGIQALA
jgi:sugar porter (SP) family MFS transporter